MENHIDHPLTVTVEQAAKLLGIGRSTAYELVHTGDIPSLRLGRRIVVPAAQIADRLGMGHGAIWTVMDSEPHGSTTEALETPRPVEPSSTTIPAANTPTEAPTLF